MESDEDDTSVDVIFQELMQSVGELKGQVEDCTAVFRQFCRKLAGHRLRPRTATVKKWLTTLGLPASGLTYDDFLDAFLGLYEEEGRLDFATRTLVLRPQDARIFKLQETVTIYAFLGAFPNVFS